MKIVILPSAIADLEEGFDFYERQGEGLGSYFLNSLTAEIESLRLYAGIHRKVFGLHRLLARRFPYAVYYLWKSERVFIRAVLDCRRDPEWIRNKLH